MDIQPFKINIPQDQLDDLHDRLTHARLPNQIPGVGWSRGVPLNYLEQLIEYWRTDFDWRKQEARLNSFPQFTTEIDGQTIHFLHVRSPEPNALPLIITHGYPGSIAEFMNIIEPLINPRAYGGNPADAFHVVAPSLPSFGFSTPVRGTGWEATRTARAWKELMHRLGYERYGAQGGDIGSGVSGELAKIDPDHVVGIHLNTDASVAALFGNPENLNDEERAELERLQQMGKDGGGYIQIQSTRPQTLAYALTDSPAGQLAWIVEKVKEWTDRSAELPEDAVDLDQMLTNISIYWFTKSGASAANFIYEAYHAPQDWSARATAPMGFAAFGGESITRRLVDPDHQIKHWSDFDKGRHFAAMEAPDLLVGDVRKFFRQFR